MGTVAGRASQCSPNCPGTHSEDQGGLEDVNHHTLPTVFRRILTYVYVYVYVHMCVVTGQLGESVLSFHHMDSRGLKAEAFIH